MNSIPSLRRRLYGLCIVVVLGILLLIHLNYDSLMSVNAYVPLIVATMLAMGLAGAEWQVFLQRHTIDAHTRLLAEERLEHAAVERQRTFNHLWQTLADSRGKSSVPAVAMQQLAALFGADLVAVWSAIGTDSGFSLRGVQPVDHEVANRLDKIAQASPCFERVRGAKHEIHVTDFSRETSPAFALFCEEKNLQQAYLCPVLVRQELVGVLVFFYQQKPQISAKLAEEMQSAANLFLCAL